MLNTFMLSIFLLKHFFLYRERDLNPHSHHWPKDFKSFVSTDSTIAAQNRCKGTTKIANMQKKSQKMVIFRSFVKSLVCAILTFVYKTTTLICDCIYRMVVSE